MTDYHNVIQQHKQYNYKKKETKNEKKKNTTATATATTQNNSQSAILSDNYLLNINNKHKNRGTKV